MVHSRFAILAVIAALMSVALSTGSKAAATLAGSEWRPIEVEGVAIEGTPEIFLQFRGEGKVTGHGGCNRVFGSFTLDGDRIEFGLGHGGIDPVIPRRSPWVPGESQAS